MSSIYQFDDGDDVGIVEGILTIIIYLSPFIIAIVGYLTYNPE